MKINIEYKYQEGYLPTPRCRKLRYRNVEDTMEITINEITEQEAPVALYVRKHDDTKEEYRLYNNKLWTKLYWREKHCDKEGLMPLTEIHWYIRGIHDYWNHSKEEVMESYIKDAKKYLVIDGILYKETGEPRYVSMTFGLGHNHGGTSLMIDNRYNSNISKNSYFNALQKEEAVRVTKERAMRRGDTESIDRIGKSYDIEVLIPEAVKCNPQLEAGDGDPFLNKLYGITELSSSTTEAAILSMCLLASER